LSDGVIGSGRRHFDGSGGNGSALRHYQSEKAKGNEYPLVVKLGTITPDGADVYSYAADEDDAVTDPKLAEHLKFWGIDIMSQVKTEQTMNEIQIDKNRTFEFDAITEHGKDLREVSGEGLIGLRNLGNSCYVNSVVQVMKECANVRKVFADEKQKEHVFETGNSGGAKAIENDPLAQTVKLFSSLTSSEYARTSEELSDETQKKQDLRGLAEGLAPRMFKRLIGEGHAEFSTARQQDAREFFEHCLEKFDKWQKDGVRESRFFANEHAGGVALSSISSEFQFETLARTVCGSSHKAKFEVGSHTVLDMCVPREKAVKIETTKEELETAASKRQKKEGEEDAPAPLEVPFATCLETFTQESIIEDYYSPAIQGKTFATRKTFLKTCPNVLALCVNRYYVGDDWRPAKMDCVVNVPERLNIESMRVDAKKDVDAYELLPEDVDMDANAAANAAPAANEITADDAIVAQLVAMGFSENGSKRAAIATSNASAEVAMEWVFAHSEDPDFNDPPVTTMDLSKDVDKTNSVSVEAISQLESMGFSSAASRTALRVSGNSNSVEAACEWLFANMDNIDDACAKAERELEEKEQAGRDASSTDDTTTNEIIDGKGEYELFGVVSHMGSNTACGHYVAHVKKNNQWILFNDEKVAVSESPPLGLGYLYFFRRL
jgi:ubiquitin carboxyl-terminal hydrolase 5/13